jgi:hypothetical protein
VAPIIIEDVIIDEVTAALQRLSDEGVTLLLVEQNMHRAMELVARAWKRPRARTGDRIMTNRLSRSLLVFATFANCAAVAAPSEQFCTYRGKNPDQGDSVACYSDAGCRFAATLGAEPIRDFDVESAPYALARGKITAVIASSPSLIGKVKQVGGTCRSI